MKKYTLLEMVQEVARAINSDEITTIDESVEAHDLAALVIAVLADIVNREPWEFMSDRLMTVTATGGFTIAIPDNVLEVQGLYATAGEVRDQIVPYAMPEFFTRRAAVLGGTAVTVAGSATLGLQPTGIPKSYTSFDENSLVLFNNDPSNVLKLRARVSLDVSGAGTANTAFVPTWTPDIPLRMFNYWMLESCAVASSVMRQMVSQRYEMSAQRAYDALRVVEPITRFDTAQRKSSIALDARVRGMLQQRQQQQQQNEGQ